jgi:subtilase family serine protease
MKFAGLLCSAAAICAVFVLAPAASGARPGTAGPPTIVPADCNAAVPAGFARCFGLIRSAAGAGPAGYNPPDLQTAYNLTTASATAGTTQTVGIVDAFDDANAESDLGVYRQQFGLAPCTTANGCFKKVDQNGGTSFPRGDRGWAEEISLDLDMVSAICPKCHILLVEATSNSFANLSAAEDTAASLHATEISNSFGGAEFSAEVSQQSHFNHPGIAITASSGDSGFGVQFPAASQYVTAVGGTTLSKLRTGGFAPETVWSGAGSGCSAFIAKPAWQTDTGCANRTVADVAADADPNTGVSVYDTFHQTGWLVFGGTSVSSPIIASVYALAGNASTVVAGSFPYGHTAALHDVTSGSNGTCSPAYLCTGEPGYDGPTGLGTPNGTGAF